MKTHINCKLKITENVKTFFKCLLIVVIFYSCENKETVKKYGKRHYIYNSYNTGTVKEIGMTEDSLKQGLWVEFDSIGKLKYVFFYKDGKLTGPNEIYYDNGKLMRRDDMENGINHGISISWYPNGRMFFCQYFYYDKRDGIVFSFLENGTIDRIHEYDKGNLVRIIEGIPAPPNEEEIEFEEIEDSNNYYKNEPLQSKCAERHYIHDNYYTGVIREIGMKEDSLEQGLWVKLDTVGKLKFASFYKDGKIDRIHEYYNGKFVRVIAEIPYDPNEEKIE